MNKPVVLLAAAIALSAFAGLTTSASALWKPEPKHPKTAATTYECGSELGYLRRVYEEQIDGVEDASITPVCENENYGLMRSEGNAGALRQHIAMNDIIMSALEAANFRVEDVVGVRMTGDELAVIYVHTFLYR